MRFLTIICLCFLAVDVHGHKANYRKVMKLRERFEELQEDQDALYETVMDLETNFTRMIFQMAESMGQDVQSSELGLDGDITKTRGVNLDDRIASLEGKLDTLMNYLMGKKHNDIKLTRTANKLVKDGKDSVKMARDIAERMEQKVEESLGGLREMIHEVNDTVSDSGSNLGMYIGGVGSACSEESNDCYLDNTTCRDGRCQCEGGLSFSGADNKCVKTCKKYGRTFQSFRYRYIAEHNDKTVEEVTVKECRERCVTERQFICRSIDYFPRWKECYLSSITMADVKLKDWQYNSASIHFQRDCF